MKHPVSSLKLNHLEIQLAGTNATELLLLLFLLTINGFNYGRHLFLFKRNAKMKEKNYNIFYFVDVNKHVSFMFHVSSMSSLL